MHNLMSSYLHTLFADYVVASTSSLTARPSVICVPLPSMALFVRPIHLNNDKDRKL